MKKQTQSHTSYSVNNTVKIAKKFSTLLEDAIPKNVLGMLVTCKSLEESNCILFYDRWELIPVDKYNYDIRDALTGNTIYEGVALFSSALNIIFHLNKRITTPCPVDQIIYNLDKEYIRCLEQIKFYKQKINSSVDNYELFAIKLSDKHHRLADIKTQLSKIY